MRTTEVLVFSLRVANVMAITGRGTTVIGRVDHGQIEAGDEAVVRKADGTELATQVMTLSTTTDIPAEAGDSVGIVLRDLSKAEVAKGDHLVGVD